MVCVRAQAKVGYAVRILKPRKVSTPMRSAGSRRWRRSACPRWSSLESSPCGEHWANMSSISMLNGIIRARAMSCCFLGIRTFVASSQCNVARDLVGSCVITITRQREWAGAPQTNFSTRRDHRSRSTKPRSECACRLLPRSCSLPQMVGGSASIRRHEPPYWTRTIGAGFRVPSSASSFREYSRMPT